MTSTAVHSCDKESAGGEQAVLITGASSGFGRDTSISNAAAGHLVYGGVRNMNGACAASAVGLRLEEVNPVDLDVTNDDAVTTAVNEVLESTGGTLDVLINNAGVAAGGLSETFDANQLGA